MPEQIPSPKPTDEEDGWMNKIWDLNGVLSSKSQNITDDERRAALLEADTLAAEIFGKHGVHVYPSLLNDLVHSYELAKEHGLESEAPNLEKFRHST